MGKTFSFKTTKEEETYFQKKLAETHKTPSNLLHHIVHIYRDLERKGFIDLEGCLTEKAAELEQIKTAEQIRTEELVKREAAKQETERLRLERLKRKNENSKWSGQPKVDWGSSEGVATDYGLKDGYYDE